MYVHSHSVVLNSCTCWFISFPFVGFETAAPCKGNGISAQGIVNGVNDTLGPPTTGFYYIRAL